MDLDLREKVVVITGGGSGIGKSAAMSYLAEGSRVVICGRTQSKLDAFEKECSDAGYADFMAVQVDVTKREQQERLLQKTVERFGGLDIWINNAGTNIRKPLLEASESDYDTVMNTNLKALFTGMQIAGTYMKEHGGGVIVNLSSFASRIPFAGTGVYAATKWGVNALTQVGAAEMAPYGIRVFGVIPGIIVSDMTRDRLEKSKDALLSQIPLNRLGEPDDLGPIIAFLSSGKGGYVTGVNIEISGGKCCVQNPLFEWDRMKTPNPLNV